jgi:putative transposase
MILGIQQAMKADGVEVSTSQLCRWFEVPRRTVYYKPTKAAPSVQERFEKPIKEMIDQDPSYGYRTVAGLLNFNKNTVQRIFQIRGWQVKQRAIGFRPRVQAMPSVAKAPDERWATDLCRIWSGRDGWTSLAIVIDCYTRQILGWHLSRSAKATTAESALEQALINRYGTLGRVTTPFLLRSDNGLVFTSRSYTRLVRSYGLQQEFITPHCPEQNGLVERVIRTIKEQCVHRQRFETLQHAARVLGDWIGFYNHRRPHQALKMKTPNQAFEMFKLAA